MRSCFKNRRVLNNVTSTKWVPSCRHPPPVSLPLQHSSSLTRVFPKLLKNRGKNVTKKRRRLPQNPKTDIQTKIETPFRRFTHERAPASRPIPPRSAYFCCGPWGRRFRDPRATFPPITNSSKTRPHGGTKRRRPGTKQEGGGRKGKGVDVRRYMYTSMNSTM